MDCKPLVVADLKPALNITLITSNEQLPVIDDFFSRVTEFAFDVETNIQPTLFRRKLRTIQVGNRDEQYVIDLLALAGSTEELVKQGNKTAPAWAAPLVQTLQKGLESAQHLKLGVNLQFDYEATRYCLGLRPFNFYDCYLAEKVIHAGKVRYDAKNFWGMEDMLARYARLIINKDLQKSFDLETPLTQEQIEYAALDCRLPFAIRAGQNPAIDKIGVRHIIEDVECGAIMAFGDMKIAGFLLSEEKWTAHVRVVEEQHKANIVAMDKEFIPTVGTKAKPDIDLWYYEQAWRNSGGICDAQMERKRNNERQPGHKESECPDCKAKKVIRSLNKDIFFAQRKIVNDWAKAVLTFEGEAAINYGSKPQTLAALRKMGVNIKNTNDKTLDKHKKHPAVAALREYRTSEKLLDTYGLGFLERYVDSDTGRIHSNMNQLGADTGRTSSSSPNIQNLPKSNDYRHCFVARPGYKLITRDYDGCELRIMAELSGEQVWIDAFNAGKDVHSMCAEMIFAEEWKSAAEPDCAYYARGEKCSCKKHKELRSGVKAINFGIPYGKEAGSLGEELGISRKAAQLLLDKHRATFPKVHALLDHIATSTKMSLEVRTIGNRRRCFLKPDWERAKVTALKRAEEDGKSPDEANVSKVYMGQWGSMEREAKNTPFQGTNADMAKLAFGKMWFDLEPVYGAAIVNFVHDEFVVEAPDDKAEACAKFVGEMMECAGGVYVKKMPMTSGGVILNYWHKD